MHVPIHTHGANVARMLNELYSGREASSNGFRDVLIHLDISSTVGSAFTKDIFDLAVLNVISVS